MNRRSALFVVTLLAELLGLAGCASQQSRDAGATETAARPFSLQTVAGYIVPEDQRGVTAIGNGVLTEVSPVWYQPADSGQVIFASGTAEKSAATIESMAQRYQVSLVPSISNYRRGMWDAALIHRLITNHEHAQAHIAAIVHLVTFHQWSGVDIDYESLAATDRSAYSAFIQDLATALHQAKRRLTLTVHAKVAEPGDWSGARAQDWQALGASADEVRVMAYDYSTEDTSPGPIAPLPWVEDILKLAGSEIPRDKIILGVPTYGYDWSGNQDTSDLQWSAAQALAEAYVTSATLDQRSQSPWFTYTDDQGNRHTVWYEDARSLHAKIEIALRDQIQGVVLWRLGGEDPAIWKELRGVQ